MSALSEERKGEGYTLAGMLLWGLFPVVTVLSFTLLPSLISYLWSLVFASVFFAAVVTARRKWSELKSFELWKRTAYIVFFIGVLYYGFYFVGLSYTTAGNAAIIAVFEIFASFVFFHVLRREHISRAHIVGAILMIIGAVIVLGRNFAGVNIGDIFILAATLSAPAGNLFQQRARQIASSESIMFLRSIMSIPIIFALAMFLGMSAPLESVYASLIFLVLNGVVFLGLQKVFWLESIHRISVTKATALSALAPLVALAAAWIVLAAPPTAWQLLSLVPLLLGTLLLTDQIRLMDCRVNELSNE